MSNACTHHFEVVDLLPNLLSKQGGETVAGRNLSTSVVLAARPGFVELNARAEHDISTGNSLRGDRRTLGLGGREPSCVRKEVILSGDLDGVVLVSWGSRRLVRCRGSTGVR